MLMASILKKRTGAYHHGDLRRALLDATLAIVEREGTGAISLSAAARRVGVSPQAAYNHFRDKESLLVAAAEEGMRELERMMRAARGLEETGLAYVQFARERPAQFRLLGVPELADKSRHPTLIAAYESAFSVLLSAIEEAQAAGTIRKTDSRRLAAAAWSIVHGHAWLEVDALLPISGRPDSARDVLRVLFKGMAPRG